VQELVRGRAEHDAHEGALAVGADDDHAGLECEDTRVDCAPTGLDCADTHIDCIDTEVDCDTDLECVGNTNVGCPGDTNVGCPRPTDAATNCCVETDDTCASCWSDCRLCG
jgi:hypothetical protein